MDGRIRRSSSDPAWRRSLDLSGFTRGGALEDDGGGRQEDGLRVLGRHGCGLNLHGSRVLRRHDCGLNLHGAAAGSLGKEEEGMERKSA